MSSQKLNLTERLDMNQILNGKPTEQTKNLSLFMVPYQSTQMKRSTSAEALEEVKGRHQGPLKQRRSKAACNDSDESEDYAR